MSSWRACARAEQFSAASRQLPEDLSWKIGRWEVFERAMAQASQCSRLFLESVLVRRRGMDYVIKLLILLVPEAGFEPASCCQGEILSLLRLPFRHSGAEGRL